MCAEIGLREGYGKGGVGGEIESCISLSPVPELRGFFLAVFYLRLKKSGGVGRGDWNTL